MNSSWCCGYDQVYALVELNNQLYAGLGNSTDESEVWRYDANTTSWAKVGGDGVNSSWNGGIESAASLAVLDGNLYAGLSENAGDAEVWRYTPGGVWTKVGGDGVNSSWNGGHEMVRYLRVAGTKLYAALGYSTDNAELWEYDPAGGSWTKTGGDGVNNSWSSGYESVFQITVLNGKLYVSLGESTGDAEVWEYVQ